MECVLCCCSYELIDHLQIEQEKVKEYFPEKIVPGDHGCRPLFAFLKVCYELIFWTLDFG